MLQQNIYDFIQNQAEQRATTQTIWLNFQKSCGATLLEVKRILQNLEQKNFLHNKILPDSYVEVWYI